MSLKSDQLELGLVYAFNRDRVELMDKQTDGPNMKKSIFFSNISFCLAPLIKVHGNCYYQIKAHLD